MAVYPKIRGVPDEKRKKLIKDAGMEQNKSNLQIKLTKEKLKKFTEDKERDDYNQELAQLAKAEKEKAKYRAMERHRKELETTRKMDEQVVQKAIKSKI